MIDAIINVLLFIGGGLIGFLISALISIGKGGE